MLLEADLSFLRWILHIDCLQSSLWGVAEVNGKDSLCFFFLMTGAKTAEVIALELMHDDVESPIPLERSDLVGEVSRDLQDCKHKPMTVGFVTHLWSISPFLVGSIFSCHNIFRETKFYPVEMKRKKEKRCGGFLLSLKVYGSFLCSFISFDTYFFLQCHLCPS